MSGEYNYWLANIAGVGRVKIFKLLEYFGNSKNIFLSSERQLLESKAFSERERQSFLAQRAKWEPGREYERFLEKGIGFCVYDDADYPARLRDIPDAPYGLYYLGRLPEARKKAVAVIGARYCSEYGRYMAGVFGRELAREGIQIISGMARGIDGISQGAALAAGGSSFGVLGCGVDICYPSGNRELYERLKAEGGLLSEYPPGMQPRANLFPPRNRIISGLADAVLVIEAREKSGTLITVDMALEQGKEVFALPGRVTDALSRGCNGLIGQGATPAWSPGEVIRELNGRGGEIEPADLQVPRGLSGQEELVFSLLELNPKPLEQLYQELLDINGKWELTDLYNILLSLQMKAAVKKMGQNHYVRQI